jgi:nucleoside-diphosphate-sugar epimerase
VRLLVTGATGVLGAEVVPLLVAHGDEVHAVARERAGRERLEASGAVPVVSDLFDSGQLRKAVHGVHAVLHLATAIPPLARMHRPKAWVLNDRLRDEVTGMIVDASLDADVEVLVFPSVTFNYADAGDAWIDEDAPLDPPFAATKSALAAEAHVRRFTEAGRRGVVLRLARLYGPGRASIEVAAMARRGRLLVLGRGCNHVSSLHVEDAGRALATAPDLPAGIYNVADDHPRTALELAEATVAGLAGRRVCRVPTPMARTLLGNATRLLTVSQRVDARRFRHATGWHAQHPDAAAWWSQAQRWIAPGADRAEDR